MLNYDYLIVFDFETTGLNPEGNLSKFKGSTFSKKTRQFTWKEYYALEKNKDKDIFIEKAKKSHIIELGLSLYKIDNSTGISKFTLVDDVDLLVKQDEPLDPQITAVTNITDEMLNTKGVSSDVLFETLKKYIDMKNVLWCGYNIQFDFTFINELFREKTGDKNWTFTGDMLDAMAIYKDFYAFDFAKKVNNDGSIGYYGHRLDSAVKHLNISVKNTHRALDDVHATFGVVERFTFALEDKISSYINNFGFNKTYGVSFTRFPQINYVEQEGGKEEIYKLSQGQVAQVQ